MNREHIMPITKKRLEEIKDFKNIDFFDCPVFTDEQLTQMKPSHYRNMINYKPIKKTINVCRYADNIGMVAKRREGLSDPNEYYS